MGSLILGIVGVFVIVSFEGLRCDYVGRTAVNIRSDQRWDLGEPTRKLMPGHRADPHPPNPHLRT